jgi:CheY-like chemotaxis protein
MLAHKDVLVVEDDEGIRETLKVMLEFEGYAVTVTSNGKEALETLQHIPKPGLILLDLMMPIMNGWEFFDSVQKSSDLKSIPVVVLTAFADKGQQSLKSAQGILKKPIEIDDLLKTVQSFCG